MPRRDVRLLLQDVLAACDVISDCTRGLTLEQYASEVVIRSAVERQFEILGEAMRRIITHEPGLTLRFPEAREVIEFRNFLAHGYHLVDHSEVWKIIHRDLAPLRERAASLLVERQS